MRTRNSIRGFVRPSVRRSVGPSVGPSVRGDRVGKCENAHFRPCPPVRNWYWPCIRPCFFISRNIVVGKQGDLLLNLENIQTGASTSTMDEELVNRDQKGGWDTVRCVNFGKIDGIIDKEKVLSSLSFFTHGYLT